MQIPNPEILGLTEKEAELYTLLLSIGASDVGTLIKKSGLKRPTVYKSLENLAAKGLVVGEDINKKFNYRPESPEKLLELTNQQYSALDVARTSLNSILPNLVSAFTLSTGKPVVTTFQGVEGLKQIYEDMLTSKTEICAALQTGNVNPVLFKYLTGPFTQKRIQAKIGVRSIVASGGWSDEYEKRNSKELRQTRMVDVAKFPFAQEVNIYEDKVSFIDFTANGDLIGIVINHPNIAKTMRAWFDLCWLTA